MKNRSVFLIAVGTALAMIGWGGPASAQDDVTLDFEMGGGNGACGVFEPTAGVRYDRDSGTVPARFSMAVGPNGGCNGQAVSVDSTLSRHAEVGGAGGVFVDLTAAYQRQTVPVEYLRDNVSSDPFKHFSGIDITAAQVAAGIGMKFGSDWSATVGYNAVETLDEFGDAIAPYRVSVTGTVAGVEVDLAAIENVTWLALSWEASDNIAFGASAVRGMSRLQNDAPDTLGDGEYTRAGSPATVYRVSAGWRFG